MKKKRFFRPRLYPDSGQRNFFVSEKETGRIPRRGSFHTGCLDSIRLEYGDTSITLFSGDSIPWQRYGTDGVTIQADTYTFSRSTLQTPTRPLFPTDRPMQRKPMWSGFTPVPKIYS